MILLGSQFCFDFINMIYVIRLQRSSFILLKNIHNKFFEGRKKTKKSKKKLTLNQNYIQKSSI